jgi:ubiquinone/menaquinone biosynthesis C-methylase UbiE
VHDSVKPPSEMIPSRESLDEAAMAEAYDRISKLPPMMMLRFFAASRALALVSHGKAVDIGCGPGYLVFELARRAPNLTITGVDLIVSSLSLHHWGDPTTVLNEIHRVVRPGGGRIAAGPFWLSIEGHLQPS